MDTTEHKTTQDPRWQAILTRDRAFDNTFIYAVRTTGIYCRPSCASRHAKPENVCFYQNCVEAEGAGFRACKRCKPNQVEPQTHATTIAAVCRLIEASDAMPRLADLALTAQMSAYHFHRVFKATTGVTPRAYASAHRARKMRAALERDTTITRAILDAGFPSGGRFYDQSNKVLGMTPTNYRAGGANVPIRFAIGDCSLGAILVAQSNVGICAILLGDDPDALVRELQDRFSQSQLIGGDSAFETVVAKVVGLVEAPERGLDLPLDVRGTAFQQRVWQALQKIPAGSTASYAEIAQQIGSPKAVRAVAGACAANALAVAIPCHRVVRTDGALSGYRWGIERKRALLRKEGK
ncbi:MAG TPA: bifunctional DNA-binding transcriptional regulator/O6-methylguanine-DNA methyltransferase Ada [Abditibacteriaceae bacterium]